MRSLRRTYALQERGIQNIAIRAYTIVGYMIYPLERISAYKDRGFLYYLISKRDFKGDQEVKEKLEAYFMSSLLS